MIDLINHGTQKNKQEEEHQVLVSSTDGVGPATQSIMRMVVRPPQMRSDAIRPQI